VTHFLWFADESHTQRQKDKVNVDDKKMTWKAFFVLFWFFWRFPVKVLPANFVLSALNKFYSLSLQVLFVFVFFILLLCLFYFKDTNKVQLKMLLLCPSTLTFNSSSSSRVWLSQRSSSGRLATPVTKRPVRATVLNGHWNVPAIGSTEERATLPVNIIFLFFYFQEIY
jgi:hypothetical protein